MAIDLSSLPDDVNLLKAMVLAVSAERDSISAQIEHMKLMIAKLQREIYGQSSERMRRHIAERVNDFATPGVVNLLSESGVPGW